MRRLINHVWRIGIRTAILVATWTTGLAQTNSYTIHFTFRDEVSGEKIGNVHIYQTEPEERIILVPEHGGYSLNITHDTVLLSFSRLGYHRRQDLITRRDSTAKTIYLVPAYIQQQGITVVSTHHKQKPVNQLSSHLLGRENLDAAPALMGMQDPYAALQRNPGTQVSTGGSSGLLVRGGDPGQNQIYYDNIPLYNAIHLGSFFSVFDGYNLDRVQVYKTAYHAQYGGKTSSYLLVHSKEGNKDSIEIQGGIGLIASRLNLKGPLGKKTSYNLNYRRSQFELLQAFDMNEAWDQLKHYTFSDFSAGIKTTCNDNNSIAFQFYQGKDNYMHTYHEDLNSSLMWGNTGFSLTWNQLLTEHLYQQTSLYYTSYRSRMSTTQAHYDFALHNDLSDLGLQTKYTWLRNRHKWQSGLQYAYRIISPNRISASIMQIALDFPLESDLHSHELSLYLHDEFQLHTRLSFQAGLRYTLFMHTGPYQRINTNLQDTLQYATQDIISLFHHPEPRFAWQYAIRPKLFIHGGYGRYHQYIQLANLPSLSFPAELWLTSGEQVPAGQSDQLSIGLNNTPTKELTLTTELFYKEMRKLVDVKRGIVNSSFEQQLLDDITTGSGKAYGWESMLQYQRASTFLQLAYTLSKNSRHFPQLNQGKEFPATYDRRHNLSLTLQQSIEKRWEAAASFVYMTGHAITLPTYVYIIEQIPVIEYSNKNAYRMPPHHKLDISLTRYFNDAQTHALIVSIMNLYNRKNPYLLMFETEGNLEQYYFSNQIHYMSIFSILPSLTYRFLL